MQSLRMSILDEKKFQQQIPIALFLTFVLIFMCFQLLCQNLDHKQTFVLTGLVVSYLHT
jgi:Na+/melibiose symporter-like transporter